MIAAVGLGSEDLDGFQEGIMLLRRTLPGG